MASTSTTQRLLKELKEYSKSPNEALLHLGPVDEDDLLHWEAVLKGVRGTPYEGAISPYPTSNSIGILANKYRWPLVPPYHPSPQLSPLTAIHPFPHAHLPPQHLLQHRRDLPHPVDLRALESRVHAVDDADGDSAAVDGSEA